MKRNLTTFLTIEALACVVLCILSRVFEGSFTSLIAFPFEQLGAGLRALSNAGMAGNIIAILVYCVLCLLPAAYLIFRIRKGRVGAEDGLLALLSIVLFAVIYLMINPAYIAWHFGSFELLGMHKALLGVTAYSIAAGYLILRALRVFANSETGSISNYLKSLLAVICAVLIYGIFGAGLIELVSSFEQLLAGNTDTGQYLIPSYLFLVLQYLVDVLPLFLEIVIIFSGLELIKALEIDQYSEAVSLAARKTGRICQYSIAAVMLSQIGINVLQLVMGLLIRSSHYTLSIPLLSVVFMLVVMLLAGYFDQARQLKDDNDMII